MQELVENYISIENFGFFLKKNSLTIWTFLKIDNFYNFDNLTTFTNFLNNFFEFFYNSFIFISVDNFDNDIIKNYFVINQLFSILEVFNLTIKSDTGQHLQLLFTQSE